jgi:hypothetical protein
MMYSSWGLVFLVVSSDPLIQIERSWMTHLLSLGHDQPNHPLVVVPKQLRGQQ